MTISTEQKVLATLELIHDSLNELATIGKELVAANLRMVDATEKAVKRQGTKDTNTKETFTAFAEDMKGILLKLLTPAPLPEPLMPTYEPPRIRHEIKVVHLADFIHDRNKLEPYLNKLVAEENYILAGITDYHIVLHRGVRVEVDAVFMDDGGDVNVQ